MRCPARFSDLNTIENMWSVMARRVYVNGKQYGTRVELQHAILYAWGSIAVDGFWSSDRVHSWALCEDQNEIRYDY